MKIKKGFSFSDFLVTLGWISIIMFIVLVVRVNREYDRKEAEKTIYEIRQKESLERVILEQKMKSGSREKETTAARETLSPYEKDRLRKQLREENFRSDPDTDWEEYYEEYGEDWEDYYY